MSRNEFLRASAAVTATAAVSPHGLLQLLNDTGSTAIPTRVGAAEIEQLRAASDLFASWDALYGGGLVREVVAAQLRVAVGYLHAGCAPGQRSDLYAAVGYLSHTAGFMAFDACVHKDAADMFGLALKCAEEADAWQLRAKILSSMARHAIWTGKPKDGLRLATRAFLHSDRLTATERAMLFTTQARAYGKLGDVDAVTTAVGRADEQFSHAKPAEGPSWMSYYDAAQHAGDTGHALFRYRDQRQISQRGPHTTGNRRYRPYRQGGAVPHDLDDQTRLADNVDRRPRRSHPNRRGRSRPRSRPQIHARRRGRPRTAHLRTPRRSRPHAGGRRVREQALEAVAREACIKAGLADLDLVPIKVSENAIYRLPQSRIVVRIAKPGQRAAAEHELLIADWLHRNDVPAVEPADIPTTFVMIDDRPVTFWKELPPHRGGTVTEIATALRRLHALDPPAFLSTIDPFVRLEQRIDAAKTLPDEDRQWLYSHLNDLRDAWSHRIAGLPWGPVHGDAWEGNVVTTDEGTTLFLDLERTSIGPPEWDLTSTAIKRTSFGWISAEQYAAFVAAYGYDVTEWPGFELMRDIRETRMTCMAAQAAAYESARLAQARLRVDSLRGRNGPRPWGGWEAIP
ncbi:aminoglycoside phosphotransferase family protein [Nocardia carnea]|uniref:aminoglycoside phosphotransferase family protein n=1 Tax=Nocardia carnea TaxID=37328 RepID=UPI002457A7F4|nr:aminoglycoside phosphotransferase family protein [Nocardia carnea]